MLHSPSLNPIAAPLSRWQMVPISKSKIGTALAKLIQQQVRWLAWT